MHDVAALSFYLYLFSHLMKDDTTLFRFKRFFDISDNFITSKVFIHSYAIFLTKFSTISSFKITIHEKSGTFSHILLIVNANLKRHDAKEFKFNLKKKKNIFYVFKLI